MSWLCRFGSRDVPLVIFLGSSTRMPSNHQSGGRWRWRRDTRRCPLPIPSLSSEFPVVALIFLTDSCTCTTNSVFLSFFEMATAARTRRILSGEYPFLLVRTPRKTVCHCNAVHHEMCLSGTFQTEPIYVKPIVLRSVRQCRSDISPEPAKRLSNNENQAIS